MSVDLFVNGTLMRGLALHANLDGADFLEACRTAERYRLYSIGDVHPGMFEVTHGGVSVRGELYRVPDDLLERLEAGEPPGLYRGSVALHDGRVVQGILFPRQLAEGIHRDITAYGGWREYIAKRNQTVPHPGTRL
ncbi:MAG TPA: gamma-glutamylcyclotransferase [Chloroflexota bacterium]|nr:gamma-glutamylcyclotransferase [Chloroflexota bacterium]